jgi:hypothetical protein
MLIARSYPPFFHENTDCLAVPAHGVSTVIRADATEAREQSL